MRCVLIADNILGIIKNLKSMGSSFNNYTENIKQAILEIPENNKLFWGVWHCQFLFDKYGHSIIDFFPKDVFNLIQTCVNYIWDVIDEKIDQERNTAKELFSELSDIEESELNQLKADEDAIYELIISIDAILGGLISGSHGWLYNASQSTINVIDKILQNDGIDLTIEEGFNNYLCFKEMEDQFKMIEWLKQNEATSQEKRLFR
jgi:hypothetical protein